MLRLITVNISGNTKQIYIKSRHVISRVHQNKYTTTNIEDLSLKTKDLIREKINITKCHS